MLVDLGRPTASRSRPRLQLRLPGESELVRLAEVAGDVVHAATERPFLHPEGDGVVVARPAAPSERLRHRGRDSAF